MSSLDMSVEDHDNYNPEAEGIPERCWCGCQPVREMHRDGVYAGRMAFKCTNKDAATRGGHLFRWFDTAVYYEFQKLRHEIQDLRRLHEVDAGATSWVADNDVGVQNPRMALLEEAHELLKDEVRMMREAMAQERRQMGILLIQLGLRLNHGVGLGEDSSNGAVTRDRSGHGADGGNHCGDGADGGNQCSGDGADCGNH